MRDLLVRQKEEGVDTHCVVALRSFSECSLNLRINGRDARSRPACIVMSSEFPDCSRESEEAKESVRKKKIEVWIG